MQRRSNQVDRMKLQVPRSFTEQELQSFEKAELINLVLQQQLQQQPGQTPPNSSSFSPTLKQTPPLLTPAPNVAGFPTPLPAVLRSLPFWLTLLGSLLLHGLVLLVPIVSSPEAEPDEEEVSTELLIPTTQLPLQPVPSPVQPSPPPAPEPPPADISPPVAPPPVAPPPVVPSPVIQSSPELSPLVEPEREAEAESTPESTPELEIEPTPESVPNLEPLPSPDPPVPTAIAGVPLEGAWQVLEQPIEGAANTQWYSTAEGQIRPGILGLVNIPEADFETFFARYQQQLTESGFNVRAEGAYQGTPIYRLTSPTVEGNLFITLETVEGGSILMAIWDQYPW